MSERKLSKREKCHASTVILEMWAQKMKEITHEKHLVTEEDKQGFERYLGYAKNAIDAIEVACVDAVKKA